MLKLSNSRTPWDELPGSARAHYVVPAIIRWILRIHQEEKKSVLDMNCAGYLDLSQWKVAY